MAPARNGGAGNGGSSLPSNQPYYTLAEPNLDVIPIIDISKFPPPAKMMTARVGPSGWT